LDIIDSTGGSFEENGRFGYTIFENDGTGHFTVIPESEFVILREEMFEGYSFNRPQTSTAYPIDIDGIGRLDYVTFIRSPWSRATSSVYGYTVLGRDKPIDIEELVAAEKAAKEAAAGKVVFEGVDQFTKFDIGIPLDKSGALLVGFKDLKALDDNKANVRIHIKYGNIDFSVGICFEYYHQNGFMAARTSFNNKDWGGLKKIMPSSRCIGTWELDDNKSKLEELGIYAVMDDIQIEQNTRQLLEVLDEQTNGSLCFLLAKISTEKNCVHVPTIQEQAQEQSVEDELDAFEAELAAEQAKLEAELAEENKSSPLFDGRYSFTISRYHDDEDWQELGSGFIQIKNGIMTVAKEGRTLDTGSIDLYDSFAGQINKKGNIMSSLKISALFGVDSTPSVDLNGNIDSQLQGKWDHYYDVILKLGKKE
jgi:hypothetical protein